jgi:hypothetical protein
MSTHSAPFSQTEAGLIKQTNDSLLTRRGVLKLLATGALSLTTLNLTGCIRSRKRLALDLLREKYDREFEIVNKSYSFDTTNKPVAYCCAANETDLVFYLEFSISDETIISDTYVGRKLGRQAENVITECLAEQGIESVSICVVRTIGLGDDNTEEKNPDITISSFIEKYGWFRISTTIVITDKAGDPRTSKPFANAIRSIYLQLGEPKSQMSVMVVLEEHLPEYSNHFLRVPDFTSPVMIMENQPIDGVLVKVKDSEVVITESSFWR